MASTSERLTLSIPRALKQRIAAAIPERQRSAFAAKALDEALKAKARQEALASLSQLPVASTDGEDSVEVLRTYREEFAGKNLKK